MGRRSAWLWVAVTLPAYLTYQLLVHNFIVHDETPAVRFGLAAACGVPHAAINLMMLWFFGRTLKRGRVPLVTGFAQKIHGTVPPAIETYTRHVTIAWCVFFAAQLVVSAVLFAWSLETWSLFVNVLSAPLIVLMFLGEYAYRISRHRNFPHATIWQGVRAFTDDARRAAASRARGGSHG